MDYPPGVIVVADFQNRLPDYIDVARRNLGTMVWTDFTNRVII